MNSKLLMPALLSVSFLEGGALMAFEILSSKLYTPFLGSSIYVWTSILTLTLAGLAFGYQIGGKLSREQPVKYLNYALVVAAVTVAGSVFIAAPVLESLLDADVKVASLLGGIVIIFVPVTAMGMVSPLMVGILNKKGTSVSVATGLVYGIGTLGGIVLLLLTTFTLIPSIGVRASIFLMGALLLLSLGIIYLTKIGKDEN